MGKITLTQFPRRRSKSALRETRPGLADDLPPWLRLPAANRGPKKTVVPDDAEYISLYRSLFTGAR